MRSRRRGSTSRLYEFASVWACLLACSVMSCGASTTQPTTKPVELLAMGDWGEGVPAQKAVADELAEYASKQKPPVSAMLLAGDNFYVKLPGGVNDPQWQTLFEQMYDPARLGFPFYAALGNHDYLDGKDIVELSYSTAHPESRWKMPGRYYRLDLPSDHPLVTVLMLDSNHDAMSGLRWAAQTRWLDDELAKPRKTAWVICCAHHPLFSNGAAGQNGILQRDWGKLFSKYKVDFYLCGHEHNLQHLEVAGWVTSFVMCGGGGALAHPMLNQRLHPFSRTLYGFVQFELNEDVAVVKFIGTDGLPVHVFQRTHNGTVTVLQTTRSDEGVGRPLEVIQGLYDRIHGAATQPATRATSQPAGVGGAPTAP